MHGVGACVVDETDGGGTCHGHRTGITDGQTFIAARGVHPAIDDHIVGPVQVDQGTGCNRSRDAQPRRRGIDVDAGVTGGSGTARIEGRRRRLGGIAIDFDHNLPLVGTIIDLGKGRTKC